MGSIKGVPRGKYSKNIVTPKRVFCWKCGRSYTRKPVLEQHIMVKHFNYRIKCPICGSKFTSGSVCNRHLKNLHNINIPLQMNISYEKTAVTSVGKSFPYMPNILTFKNNVKFGVHIVADSDIGVGQLLFTTQPFAVLEFFSSVDKRCFNCGKLKNDSFFTCPYCIDTWFCSIKCTSNKIHTSKCNDLFNREDCYAVRLAFQIIKVAVQKIQNINTFVDYCCGVLFLEKKSRQCLPPFSNYGELLQLKGNTDESNIKKAHRVVECLAKLPGFEFLMDSDSSQFRRVFLHVALSHINTIPVNSFSQEEYSNRGARVQCIVSIFDFPSRVNHSCVPNLEVTLDEKGTMRCVVVQPIKKGEQVFIDYSGGQTYSSVSERKENIAKIWKFNCSCNICSQVY